MAMREQAIQRILRTSALLVEVWRWLLPVLVLIGFLGEAAAAIPKQAKKDPRYVLGYVVVTDYPGVNSDGTGDSTVGIQAAINDAYANQMAVLFPPGIYTISDTLKCYEWNFWNANHPKGPRASNPDRRNHVLIGSAVGQNRPRIQLQPDCPLFSNPSQPRPMIAYRVFSAKNARATQPIEPDDPLLGVPPNFIDQPNVLFHSELRGIDFDCKGNPGAIGVAFRAAQDSSIENVKVLAAGAEAGFRGIPGRNSGAANIEVEGGRYGLDLIDGGLAGTIAVGVRLRNQTERAIRNGDFCPLTVVGFEVVKDKGPAASQEDHWCAAGGTLCLIDGVIKLRKGGLAIDNQSAAKTLYLRNIYVQGTQDLVRSGDLPPIRGSGEWSCIHEYAYTDQRVPDGRPPYRSGDRLFRTWSLIDGKLSRVPEPVVTIERDTSSPPSDLLDRHVWNECLSYEGQDDGTCVVTSSQFGAVPDDGKDDRAAIQSAIDTAEREGHGRVFLPKGTYDIGGTLELRSQTRLFGIGRLISIIRCHKSWKPTEGEPAMIRTADDRNAETVLAFLTLEARTKGGGINKLGANAIDRFNHIHWRAGRHSIIAAINLTKEWASERFANPHDYLKITDSGGGRFYFMAPSCRWFGKNPESRALRVTGTSEPLSIYGLNLEFIAKDPHATPRSNVEMIDAANVRIYSVKREMATPTMILRNCHNIALFGHGRQCSYPFAGSGGHLQILGTSDGVTIAPVIFDSTLGANGEPTLREHLTGHPCLEVIYPEELSIYKRGQIDDGLMQR